MQCTFIEFSFNRFLLLSLLLLIWLLLRFKMSRKCNVDCVPMKWNEIRANAYHWKMKRAHSINTSDIQFYSLHTCMSRSPLSIHILLKSVRFTWGIIWEDRNDNKSLLRGLFCQMNVFFSQNQFSLFMVLDGPDASALLGTLDTSFLLTYGIAMFGSGFVAERVSLRYFLTFGMLFSAIFTYMFGIAKTYDIHSLWYFIAVQALAGMFQTTGWPGVVTVVGRWFGKAKRGLIFGIWNSHTSIGNILGSLVAGYFFWRI